MPKRLVVIALLVTAGGGFVIGRATAPRPPDPPRVARSAPPSDPAGAAIHAALLTPDPLERAVALGQALAPRGAESLEAVREAFAGIVLGAQDFEIQLFVEWWARFDPPAAARWAAHHYLGRGPSVISTAARAWAREDPQAAHTWARFQVSQPGLHGPARAGVIWGWDESGEPGLWEAVTGGPSLTEQQVALSILVRRRILRDGADAAIRWANALPEDEPGDVRRLKINTYRRIGSQLAAIDPAAAKAWAEELGEGEYGDGFYRRVAVQLIHQDAPGTMSWLRSLPAGPRRDDAVGEAFRRWGSLREEAALAWISDRSDEDWLEPALLWQATLIGDEDPVAGIRVARGISDETERNRAVFGILRAWQGRDEAAAAAWMADQDLPPQMLRNLREFPQGRPPAKLRTRATAAGQGGSPQEP
jgi:hypothetical protein